MRQDEAKGQRLGMGGAGLKEARGSCVDAAEVPLAADTRIAAQCRELQLQRTPFTLQYDREFWRLSRPKESIYTPEFTRPAVPKSHIAARHTVNFLDNIVHLENAPHDA